MHFDLEWSWERFSFSDPYRQSFTTKLSDKQILMSIQNNTDSILISFPDDISEYFHICVVVDSSLRFDSLPSCMQSNHVHAPMFEVLKIIVSETVVSRESVEVRMERECFEDCVYAVED